MGAILARLGVFLISSLTTKSFLSQVVVAVGEKYAKKTKNEFDDNVINVYAKGLGIDPQDVKKPEPKTPDIAV